MTDLPEKQKEMNKENPENKGLIQSSIGQINRERRAKIDKEH